MVPVPLRATMAVLPLDESLVMLICPLAAPVVAGRNFTCNVIDWVGFNVTGRAPPTMVKPAPVMAAELTVTGDVPIDVNVSD